MLCERKISIWGSAEGYQQQEPRISPEGSMTSRCE